MTFTLTKNLTFAQGGALILSKLERWQASAYRRLMKRLKNIMKKPLVKAVLKFNNGIERGLKIMMRCLHGIEKTRFYRALSWFANALLVSVRKDGLKFTILLTSLGYSAWCYFI